MTRPGSTLLRLSWLLPSVVVIAVNPACQPRPSASSGQGAPPASSWDWQAFPRSDRLLLAQLPVSVGPLQAHLFRAPANGRLRLSAGLDLNAMLPAGTQWARFEPADQADEDAAGQRLAEEIDARTQRYAELERPALLHQIDREIQTAAEALAAARFAEQHPDLFTGGQPVIDPSLRPAQPAGRLSDILQTLQQRRSRLASGDPSLDPPDLQSLRGERQRRRLIRETREKQLSLTLPFAGRLTLADDSLPLRTVAAGEPLARLVDPAAGLRLRLRANTPQLLSVPPSSLEVELVLPDGQPLRASFGGAGFDAESPGGGNTPLFWFDVPSLSDPLSLPGAELPARIVTRLSTPACIVPKLLVAQRDTEGVLASGWREAIPRLFPGAALVAEGRGQLAIQAPGHGGETSSPAPRP